MKMLFQSSIRSSVETGLQERIASRFFLALLIAVPIFAKADLAQADSGATPSCNAEFAQLLVQQQVEENKSSLQPPQRIAILIRSADFLWPLDELAARSNFAEAFAIATSELNEQTVTKARDIKLKNVSPAKAPDRRIDVIRAIARRDSTWAKKLSEQLLNNHDKASREKPVSNEDREPRDLLFMAVDSVGSNNDFAREIFRRVMKYELTNAWYYALYMSASRDNALSDALYQELLVNYRDSSPRHLLFLSAYPFGTQRLFGSDNTTPVISVPQNFTPNRALQRQFLVSYFQSILRRSATVPARYDERDLDAVATISALNGLNHYIIDQFPDLLHSYSLARSAAEAALSNDQRNSPSLSDMSNNSKADAFTESLKDLEEADSKGLLTDRMIVNLLTREFNDDEEFSRFAPWVEKIKYDSLRAGSTNYFWYLRGRLAIKDKRMREAEKFASKVPELEHRSVLMFEIAKQQLGDPNEFSNAFEILNAVSKTARSAPNSQSKAQVLLALAVLFEKVNHSVALDELSEGIRVINQLQEPQSILTSMVTRQLMGKDFGFLTRIQTPGNNFDITFSTISQKDFEMSLAGARSLNDKYLRTLATLSSAKNCTQRVTKTPAKDKK